MKIIKLKRLEKKRSKKLRKSQMRKMKKQKKGGMEVYGKLMHGTEEGYSNKGLSSVMKKVRKRKKTRIMTAVARVMTIVVIKQCWKYLM